MPNRAGQRARAGRPSRPVSVSYLVLGARVELATQQEIAVFPAPGEVEATTIVDIGRQ